MAGSDTKAGREKKQAHNVEDQNIDYDMITGLLEEKPFALSPKEKKRKFLAAMKHALKFHYDNCDAFKLFCDNRNFNPDKDFSIENILMLPVSVFKTMKLLSVPENQIVRKITSSATSSGTPSKIYLDSVTAKRQSKVLNAILKDFIGPDKKVLVVFDSKKTAMSKDINLSSRGTAIRGMFFVTKKIHYVLDDDLNLDIGALKEAVDSIEEGDDVCYFGFTYIIYILINNNKDNDEVKALFAQIMEKPANKPRPHLLHLGGWKKLKDLKISKDEFNKIVSGYLNIEKRDVIDFYGMTEQLGTVYLDCPKGNKHVPASSEIIIRDINTLEPLGPEKDGFIQLLTPLPHSYPGISILTDDIGYVVMEDNCSCGRRGKTFRFRGRAEKAELKGCGDTLNIIPNT